MRLNTYLNYGGNCAEAFRFYEEQLGGKLVARMTWADQPDASQVPDGMRDKVLYARLQLGGMDLMGSDVEPGRFQPMRSAYLILSLDTAAEAERIYGLLSEGGQIFMPMGETFFAERFGMLRDRFGTSWMIIRERQPQTRLRPGGARPMSPTEDWFDSRDRHCGDHPLGGGRRRGLGRARRAPTPAAGRAGGRGHSLRRRFRCWRMKPRAGNTATCASCFRSMRRRSGVVTGAGLSVEKAALVAAALTRANADFPRLLAATLAEGAETAGAEVLERTLHLMDVISPGLLMLPKVSTLLDEAKKARVASKAALFIGRRLRNPKWAAQYLKHADTRVRANVVESLWGCDSEHARRLLRTAVNDTNPRVMGNAIYGRYLLDDMAMVGEVLAMASSESATARLTACWVMEQTGNERFLGELARLVRDADAAVRSRSLRAIFRIKESIKKREQAGRLSLRLLAPVRRDGMTASVPLWLVDEKCRPVRDLRHRDLTAWVDGKLVREYRMEEMAISEPLQVVCVADGYERGADVPVRSMQEGLGAGRSMVCWRFQFVEPSKEEVRFSWQSEEVTGAVPSSEAAGPDSDEAGGGLGSTSREQLAAVMRRLFDQLARHGGESGPDPAAGEWARRGGGVEGTGAEGGGSADDGACSGGAGSRGD